MIALAFSTLLAFISRVRGGPTEVAPAALSISPSEYWDGNDGRWSSFHLTIGDPGDFIVAVEVPLNEADFNAGQVVRVLPGTSATAGDAIWVVLPEGCSDANPKLEGCPQSRGELFSRNESTTWSASRLANGGLYELNTYEERILGLSGNAYYGFDAVTLGTPGPGRTSLANQLIAGIADNDFWLGSLGLSPLPLNFSAHTEPIPSLMGTLRNENESLIPSAVWSYTAGAVYHEPPVFGSLTFGGLDASRFDPDFAVSAPLGPDQSRDLSIALQSITYDTLGSAPLLTDGVYMFINSMVSHLWLPLSVCQAFETAFGLEWDDEAELYLLNDTTHQKLRDQNPTFNFTIGPLPSGGNTTTIRIPYGAFDLNVSAPLVNSSMPYFPLKRARNSTQYTLGRVFLQEAYVIADYDRQNFTVAQATFPSTTGTEIVAIMPPDSESANKNDTKGLNTGGIAGAVVGSIVVLLLVIGLTLYLVRKRRIGPGTRRDTDKTQTTEIAVVPEAAGHGVHEKAVDCSETLEAGGTTRSELPSERMEIELPDSRTLPELEGD